MNIVLVTALDYSPRLRTAALEQQRLQYQKNTTLSSGLPQVNASGTFDDYMSLPTSLIPGEFFGQPGTMIPVQFGTKYNLAASVDASQLLYSQSFLTSMFLTLVVVPVVYQMVDALKVRLTSGSRKKSL